MPLSRRSAADEDALELVLLARLELRQENLEIVEVRLGRDSPAAGKRIAGLRLPDGSRLISVMRNGRSELCFDATVLRPGDQVLAVLEPGKEDELERVLVGR